MYADVGLVRAERRIEFSAYVLPVCLPFRPIDDIDALENDFVNLAGWGVNPQGQITNQVQYGDNSVLIFLPSTVKVLLYLCTFCSSSW